jgi:ATP-dependent DNA helicase RecG
VPGGTGPRFLRPTLVERRNVPGFDDRLEVWNPGGLPAGLSVEDLKKPHESKPRNKLIARCFFLIKYIEQFGTGTGRMLEDCRNAGLPEPEFQASGDAFRIVFRRVAPLEGRGGGVALNERQRKAVNYVVQHGRITRAEYEQINQTPKRTAARDLAELVKRGVLIRHGSGKDSRYALPG